MTTRRDFLKYAGFGLASFALQGCQSSTTGHSNTNENKPNIIFIMTDDQGPWAFGAAPNTDAYTPNIDKLSTHGVRLSNCFVTTPVCSPSRASLITSRYSTEVGITDFIKSKKDGLDPAFPAWPRLFAEAGYATALIGKWHLGQKDRFHPEKFGYNEFAGFRWGAGISKDPVIEVDNKRFKADGYTPDILTDLAIDFLRRKKDTPFMLSLHYWAPHASVKRRPDRRHTWLPLSDTDWNRFEDKDVIIPNPDYPNLDIPQVTRMMREYLASVNSFDRNLGRVLDTLDQLNLTKNTIVIFTSDNGYNMGHNAVAGKGNGDWIVTNSYAERPNLYDNSLRVPTIIRWPGKIKPGSSIDQTIIFLDWFPTLPAMANINVPTGYNIHGRDFLPLLLGKSIEWDNDLFAQYSMRGAGIMRTYRTGKWKLIRDFKHFIKDQLYDLINDPAENKNLIDSTDPDIQKQREFLDQKLLEKMKSIDDPALKIKEGD
jgi:choline-sulfatase